MRPLGALFDTELSDDEALGLFRVRRTEGTADEAMFLFARATVNHLETLNGTTEKLARTLTNHLDQHPTNELVQDHLDDSRDAAITTRFIKRAGGWGTALLVTLTSGLGGTILVLQIVQAFRE